MKTILFRYIFYMSFIFFIGFTGNALAGCEGSNMSGEDYCVYSGGFGVIGGSMAGDSNYIINANMYPFQRLQSEGDLELLEIKINSDVILIIEHKGVIQFTATGVYKNSYDKGITLQVEWISSNNEIATINESGLLSAIKDGIHTVEISAKIGKIVSNKIVVTLNIPVESPDIDGDGVLNGEDIDDDNDNLSDLEESFLGTNSWSLDSDVDGVNDYFDPAPMVNHFLQEVQPVPAITSEEAPYNIQLNTLYGDTIDYLAEDRWYKIYVSEKDAGIHHLLVKPEKV
ncbi:MAG: hypothetical protein DRH26_17425, partial [Deltaproteobacteria bacterium]